MVHQSLDHLCCGSTASACLCWVSVCPVCVRACACRERGGRQQFPPDGPRSLRRGHSPRLATSCLTSLRRVEHAGLWITRAGHKQSYFLSQIGRETERNRKRERGIERERERVLASICHLLCSLPPLSRSLSVSCSYSLASWLFTPAQPQYWEQNTNWPSCSKLPPTLLWIKTWVICARIKLEWGGFYMWDFLSTLGEICASNLHH